MNSGGRFLTDPDQPLSHLAPVAGIFIKGIVEELIDDFNFGVVMADLGLPAAFSNSISR
jgi:hypothetical protein